MSQRRVHDVEININNTNLRIAFVAVHLPFYRGHLFSGRVGRSQPTAGGPRVWGVHGLHSPVAAHDSFGYLFTNRRAGAVFRVQNRLRVLFRVGHSSGHITPLSLHVCGQSRFRSTRRAVETRLSCAAVMLSYRAFARTETRVVGPH